MENCSNCRHDEKLCNESPCADCIPKGTLELLNWESKQEISKTTKTTFIPKEPSTCPAHYDLGGGLQVIDVRKALLRKLDGAVNPVQIDLWSRSWEYLTRCWFKGQTLSDLKKARDYLNWLIEETEK